MERSSLEWVKWILSDCKCLPVFCTIMQLSLSLSFQLLSIHQNYIITQRTTQEENMPNNTIIQVENCQYQLLMDSLCSGAFGDVYQAKNISNGGVVAVKVIASHDFEGVNNEINMLTILNKDIKVGQKHQQSNEECSTVLKLLGTYRNYNQFYIVTEFYGCPLTKIITEKAPLPLQTTILIFKSLLNALAPLRKSKILHRDIKPQNILIDFQGAYISKICDFGLATREEADKASLFSLNRVGTLVYQSPEVIKFKQYSEKSQIWSIGIILYELLYNKLPYEHKFYYNAQNLYNQLINEPIKFKNVPTEIAKLGEKCLTNNESKRISFNQLVKQVNYILKNLQKIIEKHNSKTGSLEKQKQKYNLSPKDRNSDEQDQIFQCNMSAKETQSNSGGVSRKQSEQFFDTDELSLTFFEKLQRMYKQARERIISLNKPKKQSQVELLNLCSKLAVDKENNKCTDYFSQNILNLLSQNLNKLKFICEYSENEKQIFFNLKEFMLVDTLYNIYEVCKKHNKIQSTSDLSSKIEILNSHLSLNGEPKSMKYYKQLRPKLLSL